MNSVILEDSNTISTIIWLLDSTICRVLVTQVKYSVLPNNNYIKMFLLYCVHSIPMCILFVVHSNFYWYSHLTRVTPNMYKIILARKIFLFAHVTKRVYRLCERGFIINLPKEHLPIYHRLINAKQMKFFSWYQTVFAFGTLLHVCVMFLI